MTTKISITTHYECTIEQAFKSPMLCDITKVHTGYGIMPKVTHCEHDENWGKPGFHKKVFVAKSFSQKGGFASTDCVLERIENEYWKIEVSNFQSWMLSFTKFVGEWTTKEIIPNKIEIIYTYTMHSSNVLLYPFNWVFTKTFWRIYMKRILRNIEKMIINKEPYLYD